MVTYDFICRVEGCDRNGVRCESLLRSWDSPDPKCPSCGNTLERQFCAPKGIWMKPWGAYGAREQDRRQPGFTEEGIHVVRRQSSRDPEGGIEKDFLRTRQDVREYCKAEGLSMPDDVNPNAEIDSTGKTLSTSGMPGQWV